jgi:tRNA threonylcarbamoyladenosine biosynthesis protein TsaB
MPLILHLETATSVCSVALSRGSSLLGMRETSEGMVHGERLAVYIHELLEEKGVAPADLDAISISIGPGSYTGLRVGLSTAKGMAFGLDIPIITLSTLDILARASRKENDANWHLAAIDARRNEVYALSTGPEGAIYRGPEPLILDVDDVFKWLPDHSASIRVSGDGASKVIRLWGAYGVIDSGIRCSARHMPEMALACWESRQFADLVFVEPDYLKPANVTTPVQRPIL